MLGEEELVFSKGVALGVLTLLQWMVPSSWIYKQHKFNAVVYTKRAPSLGIGVVG